MLAAALLGQNGAGLLVRGRLGSGHAITHPLDRPVGKPLRLSAGQVGIADFVQLGERVRPDARCRNVLRACATERGQVHEKAGDRRAYRMTVAISAHRVSAVFGQIFGATCLVA